MERTPLSEAIGWVKLARRCEETGRDFDECLCDDEGNHDPALVAEFNAAMALLESLPREVVLAALAK